MIRAEHWDRLLVEWAQLRLNRAFAWGETDCATLVREAVQVMTGRPFATDIAYRSITGAARTWLRTGGTAAYLRHAGLTPVPLVEMRHGDIMVVPGAPFSGAFVNVRGRLLGSNSRDRVGWCALRPDILAAATVLRV